MGQLTSDFEAHISTDLPDPELDEGVIKRRVVEVLNNMGLVSSYRSIQRLMDDIAKAQLQRAREWAQGKSYHLIEVGGADCNQIRGLSSNMITSIASRHVMSRSLATSTSRSI